MPTWTHCGTCSFVWDDSIVTNTTPVPSGRTPCEYWHEYEDDKYAGLDVAAIESDKAFIRKIRGGWPNGAKGDPWPYASYRNRH